MTQDGQQHTHTESTHRGGGLRSPWDRRRDRVVAALLAVVSVVAGLVVWVFSDARATTLRTAPPAAALPPAPERVPAELSPIWRAPSTATPEPTVAGPTVVSAAEGEVRGHNALTGEVRWSYARERKLCTVAATDAKVLTLYREDEWCSEVTQLDPETGERTAQRNANARAGTRLVTDCAYPGGTDGREPDENTSASPEMSCTYTTATGSTLLNTWRGDLVRSAEYGRVPALVQPDKQPRTNCTYGTVAAAADRVGVIERCPDDRQDRLTVYDAAPDDWDDPEVTFSVVLDRSPAQLVAMTDEAVAIALPQEQRLALYDMNGARRADYPLDTPTTAMASEPRGHVVPTARGTDGVYWYTGASTVALSLPDLTPQWTIRDSLGAGTMYAGEYVVPIPGGLAVLNQRTGKTVRTVSVGRGSPRGRVVLDSAGPVLVEKRGDTLVALR